MKKNMNGGNGSTIWDWVSNSGSEIRDDLAYMKRKYTPTCRFIHHTWSIWAKLFRFHQGKSDISDDMLERRLNNAMKNELAESMAACTRHDVARGAALAQGDPQQTVFFFF